MARLVLCKMRTRFQVDTSTAVLRPDNSHDKIMTAYKRDNTSGAGHGGSREQSTGAHSKPLSKRTGYQTLRLWTSIRCLLK